METKGDNDFQQLTIDFNCLAKNCVSCTQFSAISSVFNHWSQFTGYLQFVPLLEPYRDKSDKNFQIVTPDLSLGRDIVFRTSFCVILSNFDDWPELNIVFSVCSTFRAR